MTNKKLTLPLIQGTMEKVTKHRDYEELPFTDNFIFAKVLTNNPDLCKRFTEVILGFKIERIITHPNRESAVDITHDGHGVRFDVMFQGDDAIYDIEMQSTKYLDLPKRSRYYQGMIDLSQLEPGEDYSMLKKSYVIFINTFDLFGFNRPKYTFMNTCMEEKGLQLGDEAIKIFVNPKGRLDDVKEEFKEILEYLDSGMPTGSLTTEIDNEVNLARRNKEWRLQFMTYQEEITYIANRVAEEAREIALQEGREAGLQEGVISAIKTLLNKFSAEEIMEMGFRKEDIDVAQRQ